MFQHKKHIFFDLDHTLWDFDANATYVLTLIYLSTNWQSQGLECGSFIQAFSKKNKKLWTKLELGEITHEELRTKRFQLVLKGLGIKVSTEESLRLNSIFLKLLPQQNKLIEGCIKLLDALQAKYELHILSNGYYDVQCQKISSSSIERYFKHVITHDMAGARKPDLSIFTYAQKQTTAKPEESLMIGDSLLADVKGAKNAGWDAIYFSQKPKSKKCICVSRLEELLEYL